MGGTMARFILNTASGVLQLLLFIGVCVAYFIGDKFGGPSTALLFSFIYFVFGTVGVSVVVGLSAIEENTKRSADILQAVYPHVFVAPMRQEKPALPGERTLDSIRREHGL